MRSKWAMERTESAALMADVDSTVEDDHWRGRWRGRWRDWQHFVVAQSLCVPKKSCNFFIGSGYVPAVQYELHHVVGAEVAAAIGARVRVLGGGRDAEEAAQTQSEST